MLFPQQATRERRNQESTRVTDLVWVSVSMRLSALRCCTTAAQYWGNDDGCVNNSDVVLRVSYSVIMFGFNTESVFNSMRIHRIHTSINGELLLDILPRTPLSTNIATSIYCPSYSFSYSMLDLG